MRNQTPELRPYQITIVFRLDASLGRHDKRQDICWPMVLILSAVPILNIAPQSVMSTHMHHNIYADNRIKTLSLSRNIDKLYFMYHLKCHLKLQNK